MSKQGWVVVLPWNSTAVCNSLFSKISLYDYENMCSLVSLSIEENLVKSNDLLYDSRVWRIIMSQI